MKNTLRLVNQVALAAAVVCAACSDEAASTAGVTDATVADSAGSDRLDRGLEGDEEVGVEDGSEEPDESLTDPTEDGALDEDGGPGEDSGRPDGMDQGDDGREGDGPPEDARYLVDLDGANRTGGSLQDSGIHFNIGLKVF